MQIIKEHLKKNEYKPVYLLYGSEDYLKKMYRDKLKAGILNESAEMNYSYFEGKGMDENQVMEIALTLPFFSERRLVVIENSGWFKNQNTFSDDIKQLPETTFLVFVENEVDKRSKMYKAVKELGVISEMNGLDEKHLKLWIGTMLAKEKKKITESNAQYLLHKSGTDMEGLSNEIEKLICYAIDREVITKEDIDAVCTTMITGKIFLMIDAIAAKKQTDALNLYYDLLSLRERPMTILFLITRHLNILLQVKELKNRKVPNGEIAKKAGIPPFTVGKYATQAENFSAGNLISSLKSCADMEEQVKTGRMADQMGVELLIVLFSGK